MAVLTALTPGALEFGLRVWTDRKDWGNLRSDPAVGVHDGSAQAGIEAAVRYTAPTHVILHS